MIDKSLHIKLGQRIQDLRNELNFSQQVLAAKCGYEKSYMSRIEAGVTDARISTYERIAKGLDVEIIELFKFND